jgi:hypothetical protein
MIREPWVGAWRDNPMIQVGPQQSYIIHVNSFLSYQVSP